MHDERTGVRPALQSPERKHCPACDQTKPLANFSATPSGRSSCCRDCRRAAARLAGRRRQAAMRLLIAAHPEEWAGLLSLVCGRHQLGGTRPKAGGRGA